MGSSLLGYGLGEMAGWRWSRAPSIEPGFVKEFGFYSQSSRRTKRRIALSFLCFFRKVKSAVMDSRLYRGKQTRKPVKNCWSP